MALREIPGVPNYAVDEAGVVWSLQPGRHGKWAGRPHAIRSFVGGNGYARVTLRVQGKRQAHFVHRLVSMAFHGPCPEGMEVCHLDGQQSNNAPANLCYATHRQNALHRWDHGTMAYGQKSHLARLSDADVASLWDGVKSGASCKEIREIYGVSEAYVYALKSGRIRKHITGLGLNH